MRKVHEDCENPIDHFLLHVAEIVCPFFRSIHATPNMLTTMSNIFAGICVYMILNGHKWYAFIMFWMAYFFDCLDGHYARKYKMVTIFGDYYDHISDIFKIVIILIALYLKYPSLFMKYTPILAIVLIGTGMHMYYQEVLYNSADHSPTLSALSILPFPKEKEEHLIKYTRYFGCGSLMLVISLIILAIMYQF
jgi:phosphatidylglycerophosphate synthase